MIPHLITARLDLLPVSSNDLETLCRIWEDPDVRRFLFDDEPVSRNRAADVLSDCLEAMESGIGLWIVRLHDNDRVIGCAGLMLASTAAKYDPRLTGAIEPLAAFSPSFWGCGYATEALNAVLRYAFTQLDLPRLAAVNDVPNESSDRLVKRLGFTVTGECEGPKYRLRTYVLSREQFLKLHQT